MHRGVLCSFQVPENTIVAVCCDGVDDNGATNQETFCKMLLDPEYAAKTFFDNHLGLSEIIKQGQRGVDFIKAHPLPIPKSTMEENLGWLVLATQPGGPLSHLDKDWKKGLNYSHMVFKNAPDQKSIRSSEFMANYAAGKMSGD